MALNVSRPPFGNCKVGLTAGDLKVIPTNCQPLAFYRRFEKAAVLLAEVVGSAGLEPATSCLQGNLLFNSKREGAMANKRLVVPENFALLRHWAPFALYSKDPQIAMKAFELAIHYMFGKPVQPVVGEELAPPIKIDISAIPKFRVPAS
jgi:hypothetical protein